MRTAIYGAGSLGTILGAFINRTGMPIDLINRNKAHVEALQSDGAKVTGTIEFNQKVNAYTPDMMSGEYDIIFLMTKQQNNKEVVMALKEYLAPDGVLVTFQNGLPEVQIAEILGEERVLGCTVAWGATMQSPGVCELTSEPDALSFCESKGNAGDDGHRGSRGKLYRHTLEQAAHQCSVFRNERSPWVHIWRGGRTEGIPSYSTGPYQGMHRRMRYRRNQN